MSQQLLINKTKLQDALNILQHKAASGGDGIDTFDATAVAGDILEGETAYVRGVKIIGTIPKKAATIYTPTTSNQTIAAGTYCSGAQTIKGDGNLKAENIKSGVSIFGITGTDTSDATATADEIFNGETAYVNGSKVTGTFTIDSEIETQTGLISDIQTALNSKAANSVNPDDIGTCTIVATTTYYTDVVITYTALIDGILTPKYIRISTVSSNDWEIEPTETINNVVCDTAITVMVDDGFIYANTINLELLASQDIEKTGYIGGNGMFMLFKAPSTSGATATISIEEVEEEERE